MKNIIGNKAYTHKNYTIARNIQFLERNNSEKILL